nr:MAG TPA: hypothetical protein [Caudoviricetes sp.]
MYVAVDFRRFCVDLTATYCNTVLQWRYFLCRFGDGFSPSEFLLSPDKYGDFGASAGGGCSTAKYPLQTASAIFQFSLFPQSATTHCNIPTTPFKGGRYVAVGCCTHFVSIFSPQIFGKKMKKLSPNDRKYIAEYRRWFDKLPERQKAIMKKQGLDKPHIDDYTTRQAFDISDIQIADTSRDEEPDGAKVFSERDFRCRFAEFADIVFEEILRRKNVALTVECMRFIFGKSRYRSESEIANSLKMTRANVSARCVELRDKFGMEASLFGHDMRSRQSYRNSVVDAISDSEKRFERISKDVQ